MNEMEVVIADGMVERRVDTIQKYSHTCNTGDGKIFVSDVENTVTLKTNEWAEDARGTNLHSIRFIECSFGHNKRMIKFIQ